VPFIDHLDERCRGNRPLRQRQLAFVHEWDVLLDDLQRRPTVAEYAERWRTPRSTAYSMLEEFRRVFPGQHDPTAICKEIWDGVSAQQGEAPFGFVDMDRVRVIPTDRGSSATT
jgi:hypothetical protein